MVWWFLLFVLEGVILIAWLYTLCISNLVIVIATRQGMTKIMGLTSILTQNDMLDRL